MSIILYGMNEAENIVIEFHFGIIRLVLAFIYNKDYFSQLSQDCKKLAIPLSSI